MRHIASARAVDLRLVWIDSLHESGWCNPMKWNNGTMEVVAGDPSGDTTLPDTKLHVHGVPLYDAVRDQLGTGKCALKLC